MPSDVWKHFKKIDKHNARCLTCGLTMSCKGGSTSGLQRHLKTHPISTSSSQSTSQSNQSIVTFTNRVPTPLELNKFGELLVDWIASDMLPFAVVEGQGFLRFIKKIAPQFKVPSADTISRKLAQLYDAKRSELESSLHSCSSGIALTTDLWTSNAMTSYITVTCHWIDEGYNMRRAVTDTVEMESDKHTAKNIADQLEQVTVEWGIDKAISAVVHDNASNIGNVGLNIGSDDVACAAHTIQLAVNDALKIREVDRACKAASRLVAHFRRSTKALRALEKQQQSMGVKQHRLMQSVCTRWDSTYLMLERLVEQRYPITAVLCDRRYTTTSHARTLELTDNNWRIIEDILPLLKIVKLATTELCGELTVTLPSKLPIISNMVNHHMKIDDADSVALTKFKTEMIKGLKKRFLKTVNDVEDDLDDVEDDLDNALDNDLEETEDNDEDSAAIATENVFESISHIATALDPRYKDYSNEITWTKIERLVEDSIRKEGTASSTTRVEPRSDNGDEAQQAEPAPKKKRSALSILMSKPTQPTEIDTTLRPRLISPAQKARHEVAKYKATANLQIYDNELDEQQVQDLALLDETPSLTWWKANQKEFPHLAALARKYLAIPASSASAERVFSTAGNIVKTLRTCLDPSRVNQLVFLAKLSKNTQHI